MPTPSSTSTAAPVPHRDGEGYAIDFPPYRIEVNPNLGARITAFRLDGKNAFADASESPEAFGVTFWPSPQHAWNWPPPEEIDKQPYEAAVRGSTLVLTSRPSARVGLRVTKEISGDPVRGAARVTYVLENVGTTPTKVAPWENARMRPRGTTFFPIDGRPLASSTLTLDVSEGFGFFHHDPARYTTKAKFFADGREGWLAHTDGERLLVFAFEDVPSGSEAPGEGEIEIYVDDAGKFVEVEHQGAYAELAPGASRRWDVTWLLDRLPSMSAREDATEWVTAARRARRHADSPASPTER